MHLSNTRILHLLQSVFKNVENPVITIIYTLVIVVLFVYKIIYPSDILLQLLNHRREPIIHITNFSIQLLQSRLH